MNAAATVDRTEKLVARSVLLAILLLTATVLLAWGHFRLMDQDEVFVLQTDSVRSVHDLIDVQRHFPISLDPMFFHLLGHATVRVFGATAFAVRLPSLLGYLLMQVCLFGIARRIAGSRAGVVAAAIPALSATLFYGVQARPYGLLLGLSALILWGWQGAVRHRREDRPGYLITLAVALALALNTHYFAVLLLIPLCAAELFRIVRTYRRTAHFDWHVAAAIALGTACVGFALPFQRSAGEFRKHYYNAGEVSLHAVTQSYRALFVNYTTYSKGVQHLVAAVLVVLAAMLLWAVWRGRRSLTMGLPAERFLLVVLAAMPFFGFLLARFVTHSIEVRYVLSAMVGLAVLIALAIAPWLRSNRRYAAAVALLLLLTCATGAGRLREERVRRNTLLGSLTISPRLRERLQADPEARLYVQNLGAFDETTPYYPEEMRQRTVLLYSRDQELEWLHHDTVSLTAMHMQHFTGISIARYEDVKHQPGTHLLLLYPGGWEWMAQALAHEGADLTDLGPALGGEAVAVRFPLAAK